MSMPKGVASYTHKVMSDKGKKHPDRIGAGMAGNKHLGGRAPMPKGQMGSKAMTPAKEHSGMENMKANAGKKRGGSMMPGGTAPSDKRPGGVSKGHGTRSPQGVKSP